MSLTRFTPIRLSRRTKPFDHPDWIFEVKFDGFRAIAEVRGGTCALLSRNGKRFSGFNELRESIARAVSGHDAVIDGEIVCLDEGGRSVFNDLLFKRKGAGCFLYAFDLLSLDGEDLREKPLLQRKARLRKLVPRRGSRLLYLDHLDARGCELFAKACELDLEGIVAKRKDVAYRATVKPSPYWIKIKNQAYTQAEGRQELFEPGRRIDRRTNRAGRSAES